MNGFKPKFTRIQEGFSQNRRIPRLGRIRLGIKVQKLHNGQPVFKDGKPVEYPKETEHFVVPEEVARVYGDRPTELDVMFFSNDPEIIFPQSLIWYGSSKGVKCRGNGVEAERYNEQTSTWEPRTCPCEQRKTKQNLRGECDEVGHLLVTLPKVNVGGVYQIDTRSYNSTVDINSGLELVQALLATPEHPEGRIAMVPLKLRRVKRDTHHDGKKQIHYPMTLTLDADVAGLHRLREDTKRILHTARFQIEGPAEENPALDPPDAVTDDESEDAEVVDDSPIRTNPAPSHSSGLLPLERGQPEMDAAWLSEIIDMEDAMRGTRQGKEALRSIRNDCGMVENHYPDTWETQEKYRTSLRLWCKLNLA